MMLEDFIKVVFMAFLDFRLLMAFQTAESISQVKIFAQSLKVTELLLAVNPGTASTGLSKKTGEQDRCAHVPHRDVAHHRFLRQESGHGQPQRDHEGLRPSYTHARSITILQAMIQDHANAWGITAEAIEDKAQWSNVTSRVRLCLTDCRYELKKVLSDSVWVAVKSEDGDMILTDREDPLDIIKLCEALVAIVPDADVNVTLPMLGRVALLVFYRNFALQSHRMSPQRQILIEVNTGMKFWEKVDEQLAALRVKYDHDKTRISNSYLIVAPRNANYESSGTSGHQLPNDVVETLGKIPNKKSPGVDGSPDYRTIVKFDIMGIFAGMSGPIHPDIAVRTSG
ncbi:hypothetical protein DFH08DRAFT_799698 [Mycena albidolilacea]|uniref:Uncharacterized protein n=1 Tax=Mycena albidolilacea TaxID=1033008 RepID=A0AAD7AMT3_9AGAR|nr:hypothetical protein DFH08DRAFT_799698 [Mycena albidolilacea]